MNELELSSDLPSEAVDYVFSDIEAQLEREGHPSGVSVIQSMRVVTVNNDDELFGVLLQVAGSSVEDWITENYDSLTEEERESYRAPNSIERRFL